MVRLLARVKPGGRRAYLAGDLALPAEDGRKRRRRNDPVQPQSAAEVPCGSRYRGTSGDRCLQIAKSGGTSNSKGMFCGRGATPCA